MVTALGGAANLRGVEAAANRLLLAVADAGLIDAGALKRLGVRAVARLSPTSVQLILAEGADDLAAAIGAPA